MHARKEDEDQEDDDTKSAKQVEGRIKRESPPQPLGVSMQQQRRESFRPASPLQSFAETTLHHRRLERNGNHQAHLASSTEYANFGGSSRDGTTSASYPILPALYPAPMVLNYHPSPLQGLPPYDKPAPSYNPIFVPQPPGSPLRFANFPPVQRDENKEEDLAAMMPAISSQSFADGGGHMRWQNGTPEESFVRSTSTYPQHESLNDTHTKNVRARFTPSSSASVLDHGVMNDAVLEEQSTGHRSAAVDSAKTEQHGMDGLNKWLQATQQVNPVNAILKFEGVRGPVDGVLSLHGITGTYSPMAGIHKPTPITTSGLGRYARVEQTWYSRHSGQSRWLTSEKKWYDILQSMQGNLFASVPPVCDAPAPGRPTRTNEACRLRMMHAIWPPISNPYHPASKINLSPSNVVESFPSCAQIDAALDMYFSVFLREAPFFHLATFSISTCNPLLLFTMACLGFLLLKTPEDLHFVTSNFNCIRDRILTDLDRKLASTMKDTVSIFATAFIFLKLAALINDRDHLSPCQLLYTSLISLAQLHGLFSDYGKRTSTDIYDGLPSLQERWAAWGRVESAKRISVSLMRLDSAYATFLRSSPVIRVSTIRVLLPCDDKLFNALTAEEWWNLVQMPDYPMVMPAITSHNTIDRIVGQTRLDYYSLHAVLNYLQLRTLDAYQRLLDYQASQDGVDQFILVPYQYYVLEPSLHDVTLHVVAFIDSYESLLPRFPSDWQRTNCLVFWHFLCLSLTINQDLFEIAAGREGPGAAASVIESIATWSRTSAARRALIHSAHIHRLLRQRKEHEMSSLYAAFATFTAALVMTLYVFANPATNNTFPPYELAGEVEWAGFGLVGLNESAGLTTGSPTERFIMHGGAYVFNGRLLTGFSGARYILTMYGDLLKDCGRYNYRQMSRILEMMSGLLDQTA